MKFYLFDCENRFRVPHSEFWMGPICRIFIRFDTTGGNCCQKRQPYNHRPQKTTAVDQLAHFIILTIIGGSSFILMKKGLKNLNAWQLAILRIFPPVSPCSLFPFITWDWSRARTFPLIFLSGLPGTFIPAYLFCSAETALDSCICRDPECANPDVHDGHRSWIVSFQNPILGLYGRRKHWRPSDFIPGEMILTGIYLAYK